VDRAEAAITRRSSSPRTFGLPFAPGELATIQLLRTYAEEEKLIVWTKPCQEILWARTDQTIG